MSLAPDDGHRINERIIIVDNLPQGNTVSTLRVDYPETPGKDFCLYNVECAQAVNTLATDYEISSEATQFDPSAKPDYHYDAKVDFF